MTPELKALTQRLEEVEKQIAHLAALMVEHSDTDRTVVAQQFVVKDAQGMRRAELGMVIPKGETEEQPWVGLFAGMGMYVPAWESMQKDRGSNSTVQKDRRLRRSANFETAQG